MSNADPGYYKAWKAKLYSYVKYCFSFAYNVRPLGSTRTFAIPTGTTIFSFRLRRGPCFWQSGFRGTVTNNANIVNVLKNVYLTQTNVGGYLIVQRISLAELFGGIEGIGDAYRNVPWQWIEGEQMNFVLENPLNLVANLSITLFGKNVYASK
jgi:hypothetical protein